MAKKKPDVLIINENLDARVRLREALKNAVYDAVIDQAKTPRDALQKVEGSSGFDFIFIESYKNLSVTSDFMRSLKGLHTGDKAVVIVTLKAQHMDSALIASLYSEGVHGFISEPYSTTEIQSVFEATQELAARGASDPNRDKRLIEFLLTSTQPHLDRLAQDRAQGEEQGGYALKELKGIARILDNLFQNNSERFGDIMVRAFENVAPPKSQAAQGPKKTKKLVRHPGWSIKEALYARRLTTERIQSLLRVDLKEFEAVLNEQRSIDEPMAKEIARVLGETSSYWMRLQREYDAVALKRQAREAAKAG